MVRYQFFPRSQGIVQAMQDVLDCFVSADSSISSAQHELNSNDVLAVLRPHLESLGFKVESGKSADQKIGVPVLFGLNNPIDKSFNADAARATSTIVPLPPSRSRASMTHSVILCRAFAISSDILTRKSPRSLAGFPLNTDYKLLTIQRQPFSSPFLPSRV